MRDHVILYLFIIMRRDNIYFIAKCLVQNMFKDIRKYEKKKKYVCVILLFSTTDVGWNLLWGIKIIRLHKNEITFNKIKYDM